MAYYIRTPFIDNGTTDFSKCTNRVCQNDIGLTKRDKADPFGGRPGFFVCSSCARALRRAKSKAKKEAEAKKKAKAKKEAEARKKRVRVDRRDAPHAQEQNEEPELTRAVKRHSFLDGLPSTSTPLVERRLTDPIIEPLENSGVAPRVLPTKKCARRGLINLGNSCYLNAVIQCLSNTTALYQALFSKEYSFYASKPEAEVAEELLFLSISLRKKGPSCDPSEFKEIVSRYLEICEGNAQQDAHEFLTQLLEKLHELLGGDGIIRDIFEGVLHNDVTCSSCNISTVANDVFSSLSVAISFSVAGCTIDSCLTKFFEPELLVSENGFRCSACQRESGAMKKTSIAQLPKVLIIHLKRFSNERVKINSLVTFPLNLSLSKYELEQSGSIYSLYGVINHYGTLEGGHYVAICKSQNKWYKYDDEIVSEINENSIITEAAYIAFYALENKAEEDGEEDLRDDDEEKDEEKNKEGAASKCNVIKCTDCPFVCQVQLTCGKCCPSKTTQTKATRKSPDLERCDEILKLLSRHQDSWAYKERAANVIGSHIDLGVIRARLDDQQYSKISDFVNDINEMFRANHQARKGLSDYFRELLRQS